MKNGTTKINCKCHHEQQDTIHGKGVRVANATAKQNLINKTVDVRCTVCSAIHTVSDSKVNK